MSGKYIIITGTSRGIGEALAAALLELGYNVIGISRGSAEAWAGYPNYTHLEFDLSQTSELEPMLKRLFDGLRGKQVDMVGLVNNAAMVEPLKPIEECLSEELNNNIAITLLTPMILTSSFIKHTEYWKIRKKVVNISSGSAKYPAPQMSAYCTAKAGLNMFTQCVAMEQAQQPYPVEIIGVDPGMVETEMQRTARALEPDQFPMGGYFREAYAKGQLLSASELAQYLVGIIEKPIESGKTVNYLEGSRSY